MRGKPQTWAMEPSEVASAASRLCAECGLCCNGVMFYTVQLQPRDSPKALAALGLKLKRKKGSDFILQPCPAFCGTHCSIYLDRPERCRRFECQQLKRTVSGEITEAMALERIREARGRLAELEELLQKAGSTNRKRPIFKRYEKATAEPLGESSDPAARELRSRLKRAMRELETLLDREFRNVPLLLAEREDFGDDEPA